MHFQLNKQDFSHSGVSGIFGMIVVRENDLIIEANQKFLEIIGYSREELERGKLNWVQLTPEAFRPYDELAREQVKETGAARPWEKAFLHKEGHHVPVLVVGLMKTNRPDEWIYSILDISEEKKFEEKQKEIQAKFQEELSLRETQLAEVQRLAHIGSWEWDILANKITWSDELYVIYGVDPMTFPASYESFLQLIHHDDRSMVNETVKKAFLEQKDFRFQHRICRPNGEIRIHEGRGRVICDKNNQPIRMLGTGQDITELILAQEALQQANDELEIRVKERTAELAKLNQELADRDIKKDQFLAMLSHELRNPLSSIVHAIDIIKSETKEADYFQQALQILEIQTHNLTVIINDLLDISRITRGKVTIQEEIVSLREIIQKSILTLKVASAQKKRQIHFLLPSAPFYVLGDPTRLEQIFTNLILNAIKYTYDGGNIYIMGMETSGNFQINIKDDGIGINKEDLKEVFELFYQSDQSLDRSRGGLGVGLTLVKKLLDLHKGEIEVRSEGRNKGSEFIISLPSAPSTLAVPEEPQHRHLKEKERKEKVKTSHRILIVEDNKDAAELYQVLFHRWGFQTQLAHSGPQALELIADFSPHLVILDIGLPGLNGYEVAQRIRSQEVYKDTILIALTGYGKDEDRKRALEVGFNHHLIKPTPPNKIKELIQQILS